MGMPSSVFKPAKKRRSSAKRASISSFSRGSTSDVEGFQGASRDSVLSSGGSSLPNSDASSGSQHLLTRRISTGTLGVIGSFEADRKNTTQKDELIKHQLMHRNSSGSQLDNGSVTPTGHPKPRSTSSRPGSSSGASISSAKRRKANSRAAHALSLGLFGGLSGAESESEGDDEPLDPKQRERERARRSELIRLSRPGGTGQVTLP